MLNCNNIYHGEYLCGPSPVTAGSTPATPVTSAATGYAATVRDEYVPPADRNETCHVMYGDRVCVPETQQRQHSLWTVLANWFGW